METGFTPECKECTRKRSDKIRLNDPEKHNRQRRDWYRKEGVAKLVKDYSKEYYDNNTEHRLLISKMYIQNNPDKVKEYGKRYSNKAHTISTKEWQSCKEYFNYDCAYCGIHIEDHYFTRLGITKQGDFHKEHVNHEGKGDLQNCIPSCGKCNNSKYTEDMEHWFKGQSFFSNDKLNKIHKWINEDYKQYIIEKSILPYRIVRKKNENNTTCHYELWKVDEENKALECLIIKDKKKELNPYIEELFQN